MKKSELIGKNQIIFVVVTITILIMSALFFVAALPKDTTNAMSNDKKATNATSNNIVYISGTLVEKSLDDLFEQSTLVVTGEVSGKSDAFQIKNVSGPVANFTDYQFTINNTLRGFSESNAITIRIQGGTVGDYTEIYEFSPELIQDHEYLLFLYKPGRGGAYNTTGDYYYILGLTQGTFEKSETGKFISFSGETLHDEMLISAHNDTPVNEYYFRDEYIANQQKNLENGFITQEEYDELMANIDQYATIVK